MTGPTIRTTIDDFLGGRLKLEQPATGYRAGVDPVLLAASVDARAGESVLELGCGTGAALLSLATRVSGLSLHGVELQPTYADLCRANAKRNSIPCKVWTAPIEAMPSDLRALSFDHVIANPPYFDAGQTQASPSPDRDIAFRGATPVELWIDAARRRLKPKGWMALIHHISRLPEVLSAFDERWGSITVRPIAAREGRDPTRFLLQARKDGRAPFRLTPPLLLHANPTHERDAEDYRPEILSVLRDGLALPQPD
ncbi:MAG: methyltransferase domain-containing protein [Pseudomonadota bacterium]